MKYLVKKENNRIASIHQNEQDIENWEIDFNIYEIKYSECIFNIDDLVISSNENLLEEIIKPKRNLLLSEADKITVKYEEQKNMVNMGLRAFTDLTLEQMGKVLLYKQALRDLPTTVDFCNIVFPKLEI